MFFRIFKKELSFTLQKPKPGLDEHKKGPIDRVTLAILLAVCLLWLTEQWHGISPAIVAFGGACGMFCFKTLKIEDVKAVNLNVILALTAQFAAGAVLVNNGTAQALGGLVTKLLPTAGSFLFYPALIILIMVVHSFIGSVVTALAVLIPTLIPILAATISGKAATLMVMCVASLQYLLPFHHITMMLGASGGYYNSLIVWSPALAIRGIRPGHR